MANGEKGGSAHLARALDAFADEARRAEAIRARQFLEDHRVLDGISGTFLGTLVETAETGTPLVVLTQAGTTYRGVFSAIGSDVAVLDLAGDHRRVLLALDAIEGIRETGDGHVRSIEEPPDGPRFAELLDLLAEERPRVVVITKGVNRLIGTLLRCGQDQLSLRLDGEGDILTAPLRSVAEVVIG